ncbi:hypothetical protein BOX15_Mlig015551g3 [Macrostomum lignano]|uniref:DM domain-containing protein n=2 Tax=Macrostomum lignano TaxID=282301 RepID=A0A267G0P8_9PLAT|nr:hypothetical protein BOX15_Mlig015551g1 [Macrostomum lignano]PAA78849.1 hypothetical protein BOX15_Mlig015551g3 [Macrostomum lignano]
MEETGFKSLGAADSRSFIATNHLVGKKSGSSAASSVAGAANRKQYFCRKCKSHGICISVKGHKRQCQYKDCNCPKCMLVDHGRQIVAKQISNYRKQRSEDILEQAKGKVVLIGDFPHCRRCRNHNKMQLWKGHKKTCPFANCICEKCELIALRKSNDKTLREQTLALQQQHQILLKDESKLFEPRQMFYHCQQQQHQQQQQQLLQHEQHHQEFLQHLPHDGEVNEGAAVKTESNESFEGSSTDAGNASLSSEYQMTAMQAAVASVYQPQEQPAIHMNAAPYLDQFGEDAALAAPSSGLSPGTGMANPSWAELAYSCPANAPEAYQQYYEQMRARYSSCHATDGYQQFPDVQQQQQQQYQHEHQHLQYHQEHLFTGTVLPYYSAGWQQQVAYP